MRRSIRLGWANLWVGLLLLFAIAVIIYASVTGGGISVFQSKIEFVCFFKNVEGLVRGSPVWMSGVEVGNVVSLGFDVVDSVRVVRVVCKVESSIHPYLNKDARVQLGTIGFLGDKYIEIIPGVTGAPPIPEMGIIQAKDVGSVPEVFTAAKNAIDEAGSMAANLDTVLARMRDGKGTLGKLSVDDALYVELTKLATNLSRLTADLQANQKEIIHSIEHMSNAVGDLAEQVNENRGTLGKLITDPQLYDNLAATSARLDSIMTKIDRSTGTAGLLVNDTALYVELTNLLVRANNLIKDIEEHPRDYFKFSVF
jgi:phospholipid/cholesterol/gamma-HCH transport system substrate-binding protein